jgi:hypothetical protein
MEAAALWRVGQSFHPDRKKLATRVITPLASFRPINDAYPWDRISANPIRALKKVEGSTDQHSRVEALAFASGK